MGELSVVALPGMGIASGERFGRRQRGKIRHGQGKTRSNKRDNGSGNQQNQDVVVIVKNTPPSKVEPSPLQKTASDILRKLFRLPAEAALLGLGA